MEATLEIEPSVSRLKHQHRRMNVTTSGATRTQDCPQRPRMGLDQPERARNDHGQPSFGDSEDGGSGWNVVRIGRTYDLCMPLLRGLLRAAISVGFFASLYLPFALRDWIEPNEYKSSIWDLPISFLAMFLVLLAFVAPWVILPGPNRMIDDVKRLPRWLRWFYRDNDDYEYW